MLFSEFTEQLTKLGLVPKKSSLATSAKAVGKSLLKRGVAALVKVGTLGVVDLRDMKDELAKAQTEAIAEAAGDVTGDLVKEYAATKRSIEDFKAELTILS